ncbi:hypothetical protein TRFO_18043 [Tritrichomonas foetus]|uniref:Uncharacterized protein n=1 Tax=Tritrichomonas foetus TaxID=1144522 RepID=A0A1J4KRZ6_9EUKA|nr:hypothetical protein TRFO_18043 [Tritrichomonas foetus]|eukprot:OHT12237.1 hypothetical protein TRFO_18043 [Tritrichomonas foetus]
MRAVTKILNEENLIGLNFDSNPISSALNEVLMLFKDQSKRVKELEDNLKDKVDIHEYENLKSNFIILNEECVKEFNDLKKEIGILKADSQKFKEEFNDQLENNKLDLISETRRLITAEIKQVSNDAKLNEINNRLSEAETNIIKMFDDFDSLTIPPMASSTTNANPENFGSIRITRVEKDLKELAQKVQSFPTVEENLNDIMINYPLMTRRVEKKLNDYISNNEKSNILGDFPLPPSAMVQNTPITEKITSTTPKSTQEIPITKVAEKNPNSGQVKLTSFQKIVTEPTEIVFDDIPIDFNIELEITKKKVNKDQNNEKKNDTVVCKIPDNGSIKDIECKILTPMMTRRNNNDDDGQIIMTNTTKEGQVIRVIENKTYKTEMNSSVRVVTELEWARNLIQQHHEAIRQLQQNVKTQQENFDTVIESLTKVNATNNSRIAQLAQQINNLKTGEEELVRKTNDQISKVYSVLGQVTLAKSQPIENSNSENLEKEIVDMSSRSRISPLDLEEKDEIENTDNNIIEPELDHDPVDNIKETVEDEESARSKKEVANKLKTARFVDLKNENNEKNKHFTFTMSHFTLNANSMFMIAEVRTLNEGSRNNISHMELFNSNGYMMNQTSRSEISARSNAIIQESQRSSETSISSQTVDEAVKPENLSPTSQNLQPQLPNTVMQPVKQTTIIGGDFFNFGKLPKRSDTHEISQDDIPMELIEDKVSILARKVVSILVDGAKRDFIEQEKKLQKTVDGAVSQIDNKIDREFVERMFNKFRVALGEMNEKIENIQCSFLEWVTRDELEVVLQNFVNVISDVKDTAASKSKYNCLLCGKPRNHVAGMMVKEERKQLQSRSSYEPVIKKPVVKHRNTIQQDDGKVSTNLQSFQVKPQDILDYMLTK